MNYTSSRIVPPSRAGSNGRDYANTSPTDNIFSPAQSNFFSLQSQATTPDEEHFSLSKRPLSTATESILESDISEILDVYAGSFRGANPRFSQISEQSVVSSMKRARRQSSVYQDTLSELSFDANRASLEHESKRRLISINENILLNASQSTVVSNNANQDGLASVSDDASSASAQGADDTVLDPLTQTHLNRTPTGFSRLFSAGDQRLFKQLNHDLASTTSQDTHLITNGLLPSASSRNIGSNFYNLRADDVYGNTFNFKELEGKVVIVVNISFYGKLAAKNFRFLNYLQKKYGPQGLVIIGFPCNQFSTRKTSGLGGAQDGSAQGLHARSVSLSDLNTIMEQQKRSNSTSSRHERSQSNSSTMVLNRVFTSVSSSHESHNVEELIAKHNIEFPVFGEVKVNGKQTSSIYAFLKNDKKGVFGTKFIKWNFEKFIIDQNGNVNKRFSCLKNNRQIEEAVRVTLENQSVVIDACQPIVGFNQAMFD